MKSEKILTFVLALITFSCTQQQQSTITDLIKPVTIKQGTTAILTLSDLFYADKYDVNFVPNKNFNIQVDDIENTVEITALNNFSGLDLISFDLSGKTYELPVKLDLKKEYSFTYKPEGSPERVNLFGQFNGWDRENLPMKDEDGDGIYNISVPLDPGRYEYKFFVDGAELIDPLNPENVPNGMGDFNSVLVIAKSVSDNHYLHLLNYKEEEKTFSYNFYYESVTKDLITKKNIVALIDNFKINPENIKLEESKIRFIN